MYRSSGFRGHTVGVGIVLALLLVLPFRIESGPYAGAYRYEAGGTINWYFATTALLRLPRVPLPETRAYLDAYLLHLKADDTIDDAEPTPAGAYVAIDPDSEDAYASTFLSLAVRYERDSGDRAWWQRNVSRFVEIAYRVLLTQVRPDGLIRAKRTIPVGYLMDNVEDYTGLRDLASELNDTHAPDAAYVQAFVAPLGVAVHRLYDERTGAFRWSDTGPSGKLDAYPSCAAQLFPLLAGVTSGDPVEDARHRRGARETMMRCRFSIRDEPNQALRYALFIESLPSPTRSERLFAQAVREVRQLPRTIETISLQAALAR
jgi:hypothetical protein